MEGRVMGIYIKGFKPQDGLYVIKDGVIRKYKGNGGTVRPYELVEVKEPHGRLIDADALLMQSTRRRAMSRPISAPVFDIGRDLQRAYDEGYKQGRYDEKVETETSLQNWEPTHALRTETHACDLIKRQDAIDKVEEWIETYNSGRGGKRERDAIKRVISGIKKLPSAQPEIIRCRDCKYFAGEGMYCGQNICVQFDHFYCYYGERKE